MPTITIDGRAIDVPAGTTVLEAAERLGIEIPSLCHLKGCDPSTSCLVCVVRISGTSRVLPSCATRIEDGMAVESETEAVHALRRTALELLLSDHVGDCLAPCYFMCPAHMDIPLMLRQIGREEIREAIATVKRDIALPAVLGRVCSKPCEKGCRRAPADGAVAVCDLKRFVAEEDLATGEPYLPEVAAPSGKRVAVVGGGPAGLAAAYYLVQAGHAVDLFEREPLLGGRLRSEFSEEQLPAEILDAELESLLAVGIEVHTGAAVATADDFEQLRREFDALLVATGAAAARDAGGWGLAVAARGIDVERTTYQTNLPAVFAAGNALRGKGMVVRSVADGKEAAWSIHRVLSEGGGPLSEKPFSVRMGKVAPDQLGGFLVHAGTAPRQEADGGAAEYSLTEAVSQAERCLGCGCRAHCGCRLERYASRYGADPNRYGASRRPYEVLTQHAQIVYEPGKCIACELCIQIAARGGEPLGLAFVGRGFDVRVAVPFDRSLEEALSKVAAECVAACPTAALSFKAEPFKSALPILGQ